MINCLFDVHVTLVLLRAARDLEVVGHFEYARYRIAAYTSNLLVHLTVDHAVERHVAVLHRDADGLCHDNGVPSGLLQFLDYGCTGLRLPLLRPSRRDEPHASSEIRREDASWIVLRFCLQPALYLWIHDTEGCVVEIRILAEVNATSSVDHHRIELPQSTTVFLRTGKSIAKV